MIHLASQGNFDAFAQREMAQNIGFARIIAMGAFMSATCAEDLHFVTEEDIRAATEGTFLGDYRVRRQLAACGHLGRGARRRRKSPGAREQRHPGVAHLRRVRHRDAARRSRAGGRAPHERAPRGLSQPEPQLANPDCATRLMANFIEAGHAEDLDVSCVAETRRPPFDISLGRKDDSR